MPLCGSVPGSLLWDNNNSSDGHSGFVTSAIMKPPVRSGMTQAISFSCSCCLDTRRLSEKAWLRNSRGGDERLTAGTHGGTSTKRQVTHEVAYMTDAVPTTYFIN